MRVEHLAEGVTLYCGDAREIVPTLGRVDACVTDPPYGMAFQSNHRAVQHDAIARPQLFVERPAPAKQEALL